MKKYVQHFTFREGIDGEPFPSNDNESKETKKVRRAIIIWNNQAYKNQFRRALAILDIYDKAHKFDELTKKKSFWQKFKELFHRA